jgi:hypothetical protein
MGLDFVPPDGYIGILTLNLLSQRLNQIFIFILRQTVRLNQVKPFGIWPGRVEELYGERVRIAGTEANNFRPWHKPTAATNPVCRDRINSPKIKSNRQRYPQKAYGEQDRPKQYHPRKWPMGCQPINYCCVEESNDEKTDKSIRGPGSAAADIYGARIVRRRHQYSPIPTTRITRP